MTQRTLITVSYNKTITDLSFYGFIVPIYMIFTSASTSVNIIYLGKIDPYINLNKSQ
jgi:hypothetical protein